MRPTLRQFGRFASVGAGNSLLSFAIYLVLLDAKVPAPPAAALGFAAGAVNGYVWNRRWTFRARDSIRARVVYGGVQCGGVVATTGAVWMLVHVEQVGHLIGYALAVPPVTVATFLANRTWTFARTA